MADLAAVRILLPDNVATATFGTTVPINDPLREHQVLSLAAAPAADAGIDPQEAVDFFRAQIEMGKFVQQGLHDLWTEHPELAPTERRDLSIEVRPALDRITVEFIDQLASTEKLRSSTLRCKAPLMLTKEEVDRRYGRDQLHGRAFRGAIEPVCV